MTARSFQRDAVARAPGLDARVELDSRGLHGDAVFETADQIEIVIAAIQPVGRIESERQPHLGAVVHHIGAWWQDADHFAWPSVDLHRLSNERLPAECRLPQLVRQDRDRRWQ